MMLYLYLNGPLAFVSCPAVQLLTAQRGMTQDERCSGNCHLPFLKQVHLYIYIYIYTYSCKLPISIFCTFVFLDNFQAPPVLILKMQHYIYITLHELVDCAVQCAIPHLTTGCIRCTSSKVKILKKGAFQISPKYVI